jgi:hypothetical protein
MERGAGCFPGALSRLRRAQNVRLMNATGMLVNRESAPCNRRCREIAATKIRHILLYSKKRHFNQERVSHAPRVAANAPEPKALRCCLLSAHPLNDVGHSPRRALTGSGCGPGTGSQRKRRGAAACLQSLGTRRPTRSCPAVSRPGPRGRKAAST